MLTPNIDKEIVKEIAIDNADYRSLPLFRMRQVSSWKQRHIDDQRRIQHPDPAIHEVTAALHIA
jgi:hypothetical protein